jgi:CBS domain containing-hemolysin-like protein
MFTWVANAILRVIGYANSSEPPLTENELKLVMKESKDDGVISDSEAQIITRAFEFSDKRAIDIMVSKEQVDYISLSRSVEENLASVQRRMHTRLPVCEKDFSTVVGIVHMKDVWPKLAKERSNKAFEESVRPPIFVSSNLRQDQLMRLFQSCRAHLAVVRDAGSGKNVGIVTLEDILESLVGEIRDEHGN